MQLAFEPWTEPQVEKGCQSLFLTRVPLAGEKVCSRNDVAVGAAAESSGNELVKPRQIAHELQAGSRNEQVGAMLVVAAAGAGDVLDNPITDLTI